jgi:hypothetical protein
MVSNIAALILKMLLETCLAIQRGSQLSVAMPVKARGFGVDRSVGSSVSLAQRTSVPEDSSTALQHFRMGQDK